VQLSLAQEAIEFIFEMEDKDHGKERNENRREGQQEGSEGQQQDERHQADVPY
jgi:hypothetical protein